MTQEDIDKELMQLNRSFADYLANVPHEIKHRVNKEGKTDIMQVYNHVIQRTQELYAIQRELSYNKDH
jgi:CRISPR/Cas system-associated exonuclease Cas4 (RecB family)